MIDIALRTSVAFVLKPLYVCLPFYQPYHYGCLEPNRSLTDSIIYDPRFKMEDILPFCLGCWDYFSLSEGPICKKYIAVNSRRFFVAAAEKFVGASPLPCGSEINKKGEIRPFVAESA